MRNLRENNIEEFITEHYEELVIYIKDNYKVDPSDEEIEMWILNDEYLYNWAVSEGVDV